MVLDLIAAALETGMGLRRRPVLRRELIFVTTLFVVPLTAGAAARPRLPGSSPADLPYDVVIVGGRVMDPESGLAGVPSVGIRDGKVSAISQTPLKGRSTRRGWWWRQGSSICTSTVRSRGITSFRRTMG
jgi:hypothetical protein